MYYVYIQTKLSLDMISSNWCLCCVVVVYFSSVTNAFDLCETPTNDSSEIDSYVWKNASSKNCGCQDCIRKCCKPGYSRVLGTKNCVRNASEYRFTVPLFTDRTEYVKDVKETRNFIIGPVYCLYFDLNYPLEEFYVQTDGTAWIPIYNRYFSNDEYCIDESDGFTPLVCFPPEPVELNVFGTYFGLKVCIF